MGKDIHIHIVSPYGKLIANDIWDGTRDDNWFNNIAGKYTCSNITNFEYDYLPVKCGFPDRILILPPEIQIAKEDNFNYDFRYMRLDAFCDWFEKWHPERKAGWVNKYTKWLIDNKHYTPSKKM